MAAIIKEKQDLTYLKWSHIRSSGGTAGTLLKSEATEDGIKKYYKLSGYEEPGRIVGHECINELIVDRLLTILGVEHIPYELIHADIEVDGRVIETYLCASADFKQRGESKIALDDYYMTRADKGESHYDFCIRQGWRQQIDTMLAVDYLILNRDRHGANIEVLRNAREHTIRVAPLFDHGLSLLCSCMTDDEALRFDYLEDKRCNNYIGGSSCYENLKLISDKKKVFKGKLRSSDREVLLGNLEGILSDVFLDRIWKMIFERYEIYENL